MRKQVMFSLSMILSILFSINSIYTQETCNKYVLIPIRGRIACEVQVYNRNKVESFISSGSLVKFGDDENGPKATMMSAMCPSDCDGWGFGCYLKMQFDQAFVGSPNWSGKDCYIGTSRWCEWEMDITGAYKALATDISFGERFNFKCVKKLGIVEVGSYAGSIQWTYDDYALFVYESGAKGRMSTGNCRVGLANQASQDGTLSAKDRTSNTIEAGTSYLEGGTNPQEATGTTGLGNPLPSSTWDTLYWDDWVNYIAHWAQGPAQIGSGYDQTPTYQGRKVFCGITYNGAALYEVEEIDTSGGCMLYPGSFIISKPCCPGMQTANQYCGDDFQWHEGCNPCFSDMECFGGGNWRCEIPLTNKKAVQYKCISGCCQQINQKNVDCCPPDIGCSDGYVCDPQTFKCIPEDPNVVCGDGICSQPERIAKPGDFYYCPEDCQDGGEDFYIQIIASILMACLGGGIGYAKFRKK